MMGARLWIAGGALLAVVTAGFFLVQWGASNQRTETIAREARDYRQTIERILDATEDDRSPDAVLERLRAHGQ